jgi:hypothetical protein
MFDFIETASPLLGSPKMGTFQQLALTLATGTGWMNHKNSRNRAYAS